MCKQVYSRGYLCDDSGVHGLKGNGAIRGGGGSYHDHGNNQILEIMKFLIFCSLFHFSSCRGGHDLLFLLKKTHSF